MITDRDIYATANLLIKQHGDEASIYAAQRADELLDKGDFVGVTRLEDDPAGHH